MKENEWTRVAAILDSSIDFPGARLLSKEAALLENQTEFYLSADVFINVLDEQIHPFS